MKIILISFLIILAIGSSKSESEIVEIENGKIRGEIIDNYYAFEGIPYAEAPVGKRRFAPPVPLKEKWSDIRKFKNNDCIAWDHFAEEKVVGQEDCLFLNVFVPKSVLGSSKKVPVLFFIHGGAFMFGGSGLYGPKHFMKKDVVLVTINYRLGPMGFLSTQDDVLPGNLGLKDQLMALKWVNQNIEKFNGDKNLITIMGYSAGGASVHLHYMSPLSKGLFKNGVSFSGSALNPWVISENALEKTHTVASYLSCPIEDHQEMLECLRKLPAKNIVATMQLFQPFLYNPFSPLGVVVERNNTKDPFLTEFPSVLLKTEQIHKKPWLVSATQAEGLYPVAEFYNIDYLEQIDKDWDLIAPFLLDFDGVFSDAKQKKEISMKIRKHYFENEDSCQRISRKYFNGLTDTVSDRLYKNGIRHAIELQSKISPTYFYYHNYKQQMGLGEFMSGQNKVNLGISHGEDVLLIFDTIIRQGVELNEAELQMASQLIDVLINFSYNDEIKFNNIQIGPISSKNPLFLNIQGPGMCQVEPLTNFGNTKFWDETINFQIEN